MTWLEIAQAICFWGAIFGIQYFPPVWPISLTPEFFDPRLML